MSSLLLIAVLAHAPQEPAPAAPAPAARAFAVLGKTVVTMAGDPIQDGGVIVRDGKIERVGKEAELALPADLPVLRATIVTPGLVDAHATVGLSGLLNIPHDQDQLERSAPIQPELRAIDAFNARDELVAWLRGFGITTVHTGHGPGALVSGQTLVVKLHGRSADQDVVVPLAMVATTLGDGGRAREGKAPGTRAKSVAMLREQLQKAREYVQKRQKEPTTPTDLGLEVLGKVLAGEVPLLVTAHRSHDLLSALRVAREFGVKIVLDGAAEAYLVLPEIQAAGAWVLPHPAMARTRAELENGTMELPKLLLDAKIPFALQSGYEAYVPKTRVVLWEAGVAVGHGLPTDAALKALTIDAAKLLGIDGRVGSLVAGKDADLALFDGDPFEYTTHCVGTVIDGVQFTGAPALSVTAPEQQHVDRVLVWAIVAAQFGPPFMFSGVAVALPEMGHELHMSATELGLVETAFIATATAFVLPAGRFADVADRRSLCKWGLLAFGLIPIAIGCASNPGLIIALRCLQGLASAVSGAVGAAILAELVPLGQRGRIFGAMLGVAYAGLSLGPLAAGAIVAEHGWRAVFFFGAALILLGSVPIFVRMSSRWHPVVRWVHWPSLVLLAASVGALVACTAVAPEPALAWACGLGGGLLLAAFLWLQLRIENPLLDLRELVDNRPVGQALLVQLLLYLNAYCSIFMLSLFLQVTKQMPSQHAGLVLAIGSLVMAIVAPLAGRLADRMRPQVVTACGVVAVVVSSVLGLCLGASSGVLHVATVLIAQGIGFGLFSSPNLMIVMNCMHGQKSGLASALASQSRGLGMFLGMAVTGAFIAMHFGEQPVAAAPLRLVDTLHGAYAVLLGTSLLALVFAVMRRARIAAA